MIRTIEFNTGRFYGPGNQPIVAKLKGTTEEDREIFFHDKNRGITGKLTIPESCHFDQESIMRAYDTGSYENISVREFNQVGES